MPKRWSIYDAPHGTCNRCGWTGHDWSFKYQGLCSKCYKKWKQEKREALKKLKPPNDNVEITDGVVVTRNVKKRLLKQSQLDIPSPKHYGLMDWAGIIAFAIVAILAFFYLYTSNTAFFIGVPIFIVVGILIRVIQNKKMNERMDVVNSRVEELARQRKAKIEEAKIFYSSPEWRLIRKRVIEQQGKVCQECGEIIKNDIDVTVDHIRPRSIYPEEALKLDNLRVLCRSCNSKKSDDMINESDVLIDT